MKQELNLFLKQQLLLRLKSPLLTHTLHHDSRISLSGRLLHFQKLRLPIKMWNLILNLIQVLHIIHTLYFVIKINRVLPLRSIIWQLLLLHHSQVLSITPPRVHILLISSNGVIKLFHSLLGLHFPIFFLIGLLEILLLLVLHQEFVVELKASALIYQGWREVIFNTYFFVGVVERLWRFIIEVCGLLKLDEFTPVVGLRIPFWM